MNTGKGETMSTVIEDPNVVAAREKYYAEHGLGPKQDTPYVLKMRHIFWGVFLANLAVGLLFAFMYAVTK
jgi:hypothetical protein